MAIDENGKVYFTEEEQAKVNEVVQERVGRVKKELPEDYEKLKEIASTLEDFGFTGSVDEKITALKTEKETRKQAQQADTYKEAVQSYEGVTELPSDAVIAALAKQFNKDPETMKKALEKQVEATEKEAKEKEFQAQWDKQLKDFVEKYSDVDLEKLDNDLKFRKFVKGKNLPLVELYEEYVDFVGETEKEIENLKKTVQAKEANLKNSETATGSVKGESPNSEFISAETFEKNKHNQKWVNDNFKTIVKSRPKWTS